MRRFLRFCVLPLLVMFFLVTARRVMAAVTLISFDAVADNQNKRIILYWETGSELDFAGFQIERSLSQDTGFQPLLDANNDPLFIPAQGEGGSGAQYIYNDTSANEGVLYYYRLEMIDLGGYSEYSEVVSVILQSPSTTTATSTATRTTTPVAQTPTEIRTPTVTRTPAPSTSTRTKTPTRTKTRQPTPTRTRTPSPFRVVTYTSAPRATYTPTETSSITPTPTVSPTTTTTLAPLPSLTLLFPIRTPTPTVTPTPTDTASPIPLTPTSTPKPDSRIPLQISFLGGVLILLWITLAGFLFAYLRRISH